MGIEGFFPWFRAEHGDCVAAQRAAPVPVDALAIDLNGFIHQAAGMVFHHTTPTPLICRPAPPPPPTRAEIRKCYSIVSAMIGRVLKMARPRGAVVVCIDGVAGSAKMFQQRKRRGERNPFARFDAAAISPGTAFLRGLSAHLRAWFAALPPALRARVTFSDELEAGEGEYKCVRLLRERAPRGATVCLCANDADLIMYALALGHHYDYRPLVLRQHIGAHGEWFWVRVDLWLERMEAPPDHVLLLWMFMGNDFLPLVRPLRVQALLDAARADGRALVAYPDDDWRAYRGRAREDPRPLAIRWDVLRDVLARAVGRSEGGEKESGESEGEAREGEAREGGESEGEAREREAREGEAERTRRSGAERARRYLWTMRWVWEYYTRAIPSWAWKYAEGGEEPPAVDALLAALGGAGDDLSFLPGAPAPPREQLLRILHPASLRLVSPPLSPSQHEQLARAYSAQDWKQHESLARFFA